MKAGLRITVIILVLLALSLPFAVSGAASDDYFGAVNNESIRPFTKRYMPEMVNGKLRIPHFLLTDSDIGARTEWSEKQHYLTLTCDGKSVTFELGSRFAFDANSRIYETTMRLSEYSGVEVYYLELAFICEFFEWSYSIYETDYGQIVRIKTKDGLLTDSQYATNELVRIQEYYNTLYPADPVVSSTPPTGPGTPSTPPSATPAPTAPDPPLGVYITFDGALSEHTQDLLDILDQYGVPASFFLTEDGLADHPALLRRLIATQVVGLCGPGVSGGLPAEGSLEQAERMNTILDQFTFTKTRLARWPELYTMKGAAAETLSAPVRDALTSGGYRLWDWTLETGAWPQLSSGALAAKLIGALPASGDGPAVLRLSMDERTVRALPELLDALKNTDRYFLRSIGITDRPINRFGDF